MSSEDAQYEPVYHKGLKTVAPERPNLFSAGWNLQENIIVTIVQSPS